MMNHGYIYYDRVSHRDRGLTVLDFYATHHIHFTREEWQAVIEKDSILCEGRILRAEDRVKPGQLLEYHRPPWEEPEVSEKIEVLYEDGNIMVVDKPDTMPVLPGGRYLENSLVHVLRRRYGDELAPVHRLGRGTTGALLFTRSAESAAWYNARMRERAIGKIYLALVVGRDLPDTFEIHTPIGRVPHPRFGSCHDVSPTGKEAISHGVVLGRHPVRDEALVRVSILTGRTHQIRIHLASICHPLLGDRFYTGASTPPDPEALPGDAGYLLHSWELNLPCPDAEARIRVVAPPRAEMIAWCEEARMPTPTRPE